MTGFARSLGLETNGQQLRGLKDQLARLAAATVRMGLVDEGRAVQVRRTDEFSFGRRARAQRDISGGVLRLRSRCPVTVLASCSARYRVSVDFIENATGLDLLSQLPAEVQDRLEAQVDNGPTH